MYFERQLQRDPHYDGRLRDIPIEEGRMLLGELLDYFGLLDPLERQLPPAGLPGLLHEKYDQGEQAADLLSIGIAYIAAIVHNERKSMHYRWREARDFIRKIEKQAEEAAFQRHVATEWEHQRQREQAIEANPAKVYFIGSQSGPIKIGMATHPLSRLKNLQTGHHERLELLATCEGGQPQERAYHKQFAAHRLHGEWFERCPEILAEIERLAQ